MNGRIKPLCFTLVLAAALFASAAAAFSATSADAPLTGSAQTAARDELLERAKNLYDIQDYHNSLALFERLLKADPQNGEAWDYAGWCHRYLGNFGQALRNFNEAESLLPGALSKWVKVGLGETYLGGDFQYSAIQAFAQAIALAPDDDELRFAP